MLKLKEAVIVEGKYDKQKLLQCVDAVIIETGGFRLCKDKSKLNLIKKLAKERGIIIITDSDSAGFFIRNYIRSAVPNDKIKHVYIPEIYGKERRKKSPSKEGKLGLEGLTTETIIKALQEAKVTEDTTSCKSGEITKYNLYQDGLVGHDNSALMRNNLLELLKLPKYLSTNAMLEVINATMTYDEYAKVIKQLN